MTKNYFYRALFILIVLIICFFQIFLSNKAIAQEILPGSILTLSDYIEMYYPKSFIFTSQTGFYGIADQIYFSFYGNNHEYNEYYLDGFKLNSHFFPGTPLWDYILDFSDFYLDPFNSKIIANLKLPEGSYFKIISFFKGFWGIYPYTSEINLYLAGGYASIDRDPLTIDDRRSINYLYGFNMAFNLKSNNKIIISSFIGQRTFLSYYRDNNGDVLYKVLNEDFSKFQLISFFQLNSNILYFFGLFYNYRTNYGSEFYFYEDQTKVLNSFSIINGLCFENTNSKINISFNFEYNSLSNEKSSYEKEILDPDGESLYIFYPNGSFYDLSLILKGEYKILDNIKIHIDSDNNLSIYDSGQDYFYVNILYNNNLFGKILFYSNNTYWMISNTKVTLSLILLKNDIVDINSSVIPGYSFAYIDDENLKFLNFLFFDYDIDIKFFPKSNFNILIKAGKKTPYLTSSLAKVLNSNYLNGAYYDANQNFLFNTYGNIQEIIKELKIPSYSYLAINFNFENPQKFYFSIDSQFRTFQNLFWVRAKDANSYLPYSYNNQNLYYIADPDISYVLTNFAEAVNWLIQNNLLSQNYFENIPEFLQNPFYLGVIFSLGKKTENFFVNISFWAYMVVGITSIGNGMFEDEVGIIAENLADPNTFIYGIGRMISDRSYVFKFNIGFKLFESVWSSLVIRYRDGQPFTAFYSSITPNNYALIYNQYMPGDDPFSGEMGRREDCIWEFNFDITGKFYLFGKIWEVSIILYNFFDLAFELVENVFNVNHRQPLELQVPGTISIQISVNF